MIILTCKMLVEWPGLCSVQTSCPIYALGCKNEHNQTIE